MSRISESVADLAQEIRELKAQLSKEGLSSDAINRHEEVLAKVAKLRELKSQLAGDDPARDEAILARQRAEREALRKKQQALAEEQRKALKVEEQRAQRPLVQRKIFHLFHHAGSGDSFHYEPPPRLNAAQCGFGEGSDPCPSVYVTEKWDGTTMQATSSHIFKRLDLWGGKRKSADPSQRYDLKLIAWRGEDTGGAWRGLDFIDADIRVKEALERHLPSLDALDEGLCTYFEVVHTDINSTFKHLPGFADIRVFDFSRAERSEAGNSSATQPSGRFLPFEETIAIATRVGLPIVGWEKHDRLDAEKVWLELHAARRRNYATAAAPLEGYVVREAGEGTRIAKARVEHLLPGEPGEETSAVAAAPRRGDHLAASSHDMEHFLSIGLNTVRSDHGALASPYLLHWPVVLH